MKLPTYEDSYTKLFENNNDYLEQFIYWFEPSGSNKKEFRKALATLMNWTLENVHDKIVIEDDDIK